MSKKIFITGRSGIGKTTLVERFLDELGRRGDALVLRRRWLVNRISRR